MPKLAQGTPLTKTRYAFSGELLAEARADAGLTQEQLGLAAGIATNNVYSYERYRGIPARQNRVPSVSTLCRLATALGVKPGDLFCEVPE